MLRAEQPIHKTEPKKLRCELCGKAFATPEGYVVQIYVAMAVDKK